jgi:hypothetical protein
MKQTSDLKLAEGQIWANDDGYSREIVEFPIKDGFTSPSLCYFSNYWDDGTGWGNNCTMNTFRQWIRAYNAELVEKAPDKPHYASIYD